MKDQPPSPVSEVVALNPVFYRSAAYPCPYLPGRLEQRILTELTPDLIGRGLFDALTKIGFRRSQGYMYRPSCRGCDSCVPVRIPVGRFELSRGFRRTLRDNAGTRIEETPARATQEQFALFHRYQSHRHGDGDMASMTIGDYAAMVGRDAGVARLLELRDGQGKLIGCCLFDRSADGLSAVYSFFEPELEERSLGTYIVLSLIERARIEGLDYVYLGFWIEGSRKMAYKARYRPLERLGRNGWEPLP